MELPPDKPLTFTSLVFRYRGPMDFDRIFKESKAFFLDRKYDVIEKVFKNKGDEIEGAWDISRRVDIYTKFMFELEYKLIESKSVVVERDGKKIPMLDGKIRIVITAKAEVNYSEKGIPGDKEIFPKTKDKKESWLHKVYYKVTYRDRDEGLYGEAIITAHAYIDMLKEICGTESRY